MTDQRLTLEQSILAGHADPVAIPVHPGIGERKVENLTPSDNIEQRGIQRMGAALLKA